ncbi:sensor histidine kinase [Asticcacaulis solisilvae]|uniref:sensor histidine kinase n=1 Tax=Asticcacaulis solisilvae TaxID=1217274 RepID=UPI003FD75D40
MTSAPPSPSSVQDTVLLDHGLRAQARMFPYMLGFFGIGLPLFLWAARAGVSPWLMTLYLLVVSVAWPVFMTMRGQAEARAGFDTADALRGRLWRQGLGGGVWTLVLLMISLTAPSGGATADMLVTVCAGAAIGIVFFSAPVLLYLLILGPLAVAGPMYAFHALHESDSVTRLMSGGLVLALAMGFILNRHMRDHYRLQHEALQAARAREDMTAGRVALMETLSREVKTGLSGVAQALSLGLAHLARAPAPRQQVETALDEIERLQSILVTTLDNDEAEAGQIAIERTPLDLALICEQAVADFAELARSRDLAFTLSLAEQPTGAAVADARRVEQILGHLLDNAIQYTPSGRVELKLLPAADGLMRIEVVDSGPGLSAAELARAFRPHTRIARTSSGAPGAGLGLSLSKSLAELMGGGMGAESTLDVGSKFWVDLPFDATAVPPARPKIETGAPEPDHAASLRVLLLANNALRAAELRDQLEGLGHRCMTSTTRDRALSLARKGGVDACVISTGAFENLDDDGNRQTLSAFLDSLRATQAEARMNIVALLPAGDQAETLQDMGVKPVLLPQGRDGLARALIAQD